MSTVAQDLEWESFANTLEEWLDSDDPSAFPEALTSRPSSPLPAHMVSRIAMLNGQVQLAITGLIKDRDGVAKSLQAIRKASRPGITPTRASYLDTGA